MNFAITAKMVKLIAGLFVVFSLMTTLQADDGTIICNQTIDPEQVVTRCAEFVAPSWTDPAQEELIKLFFEMVGVIIGNSTVIPKASDTMKGAAVLIGMCYNYQNIWDNIGMGALAFDCFMENSLPTGSSVEKMADCKKIYFAKSTTITAVISVLQYTEKITKCIIKKYEVLCPSKKHEGKRVRRSLDIMKASRSLAAFAFV